MKSILQKPLSRTIVNQYKRHDIFKCIHQSHVNFEHRVSVYHVLKEKQCYPQGCIYFNWKCRLLNKGATCSKKFKHVGRKCFNCKEFFDEKEIFKPERLIDTQGYEKFTRELNAFEDWFEELRGKEVDFSGTINSVKPGFHKRTEGSHNNLSFDGFLINFTEGYINLDHFKDFLYVKISSSMQHRYKFSQGDRLNFYARLQEKQGRILLYRINRVDIEHKEDNEAWTASKAQLAKKTGTIIPVQYDKCLNCDKGSLIDDTTASKKQRMLLCLEGIKNPHYCTYSISKLLLADNCSKQSDRR